MLKGVGARGRSDVGDSICISSLADSWLVEIITSYSYESEGGMNWGLDVSDSPRLEVGRFGSWNTVLEAVLWYWASCPSGT